MNRFENDIASTNGKPARKSRAKPVAEVKPAAVVSAPKPVPVEKWATTGVYLTLGMSAALNGFAFGQHAPAAWAGWAMGVSIPALVLILSRVGSLLYKSGRRGLAYCAGAVCVALLALSVTHCAESIAQLTGGSMVLAVLMAIGIDCGLVVCELATVSKSGK